MTRTIGLATKRALRSTRANTQVKNQQLKDLERTIQLGAAFAISLVVFGLSKFYVLPSVVQAFPSASRQPTHRTSGKSKLTWQEPSV